MLNGFNFTAKQLFLIDSIGALLTALITFFILPTFTEHFGFPEHIFKILALSAFIFSIYSCSCFMLVKNEASIFLKIIGFANLCYCATIVYLVITHFSHLSGLGVAYFSGEILIICMLSYFELSGGTLE